MQVMDANEPSRKDVALGVAFCISGLIGFCLSFSLTQSGGSRYLFGLCVLICLTCLALPRTRPEFCSVSLRSWQYVSPGRSQSQRWLQLPLANGASHGPESRLSYYRHPDWLGSSRVVSTPSRTLYLDSSYAPFGEGYGVSGTLDSADRRFTGFDRDVAADQWISPTRQLAVVTGRWTSPDPSGLSV